MIKEPSIQRFETAVVENIEICKEHWHLVLKNAELARTILPGQFVNIKICGHEEFMLRRPFSVARRTADGSIEIVFRVIGKGTAALKHSKPGDIIDLIGPLGRPFSIPDSPVRCLLVGGGVGTAPLCGLAEELLRKGDTVTALLGFRSFDCIFGIDLLQTMGVKTTIATDDGSKGLRGFVSEHLDQVFDPLPERVYVCGPPAMLRSLLPRLREAGIPGEVSVEERMGCGYGVCLSCVVDVVTNNIIEKVRVCTEGPVFDIRDLVME